MLVTQRGLPKTRLLHFPFPDTQGVAACARQALITQNRCLGHSSIRPTVQNEVLQDSVTTLSLGGSFAPRGFENDRETAERRRRSAPLAGALGPSAGGIGAWAGG